VPRRQPPLGARGDWVSPWQAVPVVLVLFVVMPLWWVVMTVSDLVARLGDRFVDPWKDTPDWGSGPVSSDCPRPGDE